MRKPNMIAHPESGDLVTQNEAVAFLLDQGLRPVEIGRALDRQSDSIRQLVAQLRLEGVTTAYFASPGHGGKISHGLRHKHLRHLGDLRLTYEKRVKASVMHLVDLKRAGHSPTQTELHIATGP